MMREIRGVLFDFNGTLFFDSEMHIEAFGYTCDNYGKPRYSREFIINNLFGKTNDRIFREYFKPDATDEECARFATMKKNLYFDICTAHPERMHLVDGACELLDYLKEHNVPFALATGSDGEELDFFMRHLGLARWFDIDRNVVFNNGRIVGKPAPDCYIEAARRLSLSSSECAVFEDGGSGIAAARAADCAALIVVNEEGIPSPLGGEIVADAEYHTLKDLTLISALLGL